MAFNTTRWTLANILPVVFVLKIILSLWLLYVFLHLVPLLQDPESHRRGMTQAVISQSITFVMLICFMRAIFTDPGSVPKTGEWQQGATGSDAGAEQLTTELKQTGERRFCKWCNQYKPDRCHHCRVCRSCILRMDHHCPWIANCVGFGNHKFFMLLVLYAMINTIYILVTIMETMSKAVNEEMSALRRFGIVYCMTLAGLMTMLLVPFFFLHVSFMMKSQTTIEFCEKRSKKQGLGISYDVGVWTNTKNTLGSNPLTWLLPIAPPEGDGLHFQSVATSAPLLDESTQAGGAAPMVSAAPASTENPEVTGAKDAQS